MVNKHQFSAKNLDEAINEAAKYFSVDKAFVCYNTLTNKSGGLFSKIFSNKIRIEAWVETAKEDLQEAARNAVREALGVKPTASAETKKYKLKEPQENSPRTIIDYHDPKVKMLLTQFNQLFFSAFSLSPHDYSMEMNDNNVILHIENEFLENILTKSDKLSLAFEHVFKRMAQKKFGDLTGRLTLDAGSCAEKREERLTGIAKSLAEKVRKTGQNAILSSKSSQERRIIHLALDNVEGIGTRSVGMGDKRRLVIFSTEKSNNGHQKTRNTSQKKRPSPTNKEENSTHKKRNESSRNKKPLLNSSHDQK